MFCALRYRVLKGSTQYLSIIMADFSCIRVGDCTHGTYRSLHVRYTKGVEGVAPSTPLRYTTSHALPVLLGTATTKSSSR